MNLNITQDNLYLLLPSKVGRVAEMLSDDNGTDIVASIKEIYSSPLYKRLEREDTKTWHLGPVPLYQAFIEIA